MRPAKADVIPNQRSAGFALRMCGDMVDLGFNCRHIAANSGDNPDKLRIWVGVVAMRQPPYSDLNPPPETPISLVVD
jgi:hypothetical protein